MQGISKQALQEDDVQRIINVRLIELCALHCTLAALRWLSDAAPRAALGPARHSSGAGCTWAACMNAHATSSCRLPANHCVLRLQTLDYDGKIEGMEIMDDDGDMIIHYRLPLMRVPASTAFTSIPCGVCPGA